MQIRQIVLYHASGDRRSVQFQVGRLNVVSGFSRTGKTALLRIVEYCLGRSSPMIPPGVITNSVEWYALLLQLPSTRVFVARRKPREGFETSTRLMFEVGAALEPLPLDRLVENADVGALRAQLGRMIGIGEARLGTAKAGPSANPPLIGLGQAVLLCFQSQGEVANPEILFHRQNEQGIGQAVRDSLPYFLGAVSQEQATVHSRLTLARRRLRAAEQDLDAARLEESNFGSQLLSLVDEAYGSGLLPTRDFADPDSAIDALRTVVSGRAELPTDDVNATRRLELEEERAALRESLREISEQKALILESRRTEAGFETVLDTARARLSVLDLAGSEESGDVCPICRNALGESDPTVADMAATLSRMREQLRGVEGVQPRRAQAVLELDQRADELRARLRAVLTAIEDLQSSDRHTLSDSDTEERAFRRGRIDAFLGRLALRPSAQSSLEQRRDDAAREVARLEDLLDPDREREELLSRLNVVGDDMTQMASELQLEYSERFRLDVRRLTVVADTADGPVTLAHVGSAGNWVGFHLVTFLALHRFFVRQRRPVPRFLMIDQPSQAYFPPERLDEGVNVADDDRQAVLRMFQLMDTVVRGLGGELQLIVCDHANFDEPWFQDAIGPNNWRGEKLVPADWIRMDSEIADR